MTPPIPDAQAESPSSASPLEAWSITPEDVRRVFEARNRDIDATLRRLGVRDGS